MQLIYQTTPNRNSPVKFTSVSCCRWTRATRCLVLIALYREVDAQCDKLAKVVGQTSTISGRRQFIILSVHRDNTLRPSPCRGRVQSFGQVPEFPYSTA